MKNRGRGTGKRNREGKTGEEKQRKRNRGKGTEEEKQGKINREGETGLSHPLANPPKV